MTFYFHLLLSMKNSMSAPSAIDCIQSSSSVKRWIREWFGNDRWKKNSEFEILRGFFRSPSTICGTTVDHHTTASTTILPSFDQYHIVLATVKYLQTTPDRVSIVLLSQKHVYNGIVFQFYEFYGLENHPSKYSHNHLNDRRKKSFMKTVTAPTLSENEPFLTSNSTTR